VHRTRVRTVFRWERLRLCGGRCGTGGTPSAISTLTCAPAVYIISDRRTVTVECRASRPLHEAENQPATGSPGLLAVVIRYEALASPTRSNDTASSPSRTARHDPGEHGSSPLTGGAHIQPCESPRQGIEGRGVKPLHPRPTVHREQVDPGRNGCITQAVRAPGRTKVVEPRRAGERGAHARTGIRRRQPARACAGL